MAEDQTRQLLLVEDDQAIQKAMAYLLRLEGITVTTANHGQHALDLIHAGLRPSLIMVDLLMPVMDGSEFIQKARLNSELTSVPIVVLSGDDRVREKTASLDIAEIIPKPVTLEDILNIVRRYS